VLFNMLPNPGGETVGLGAVRAVVIAGLVDALATDETAVTRCDDRTWAVLGKTPVYVTGG